MNTLFARLSFAFTGILLVLGLSVLWLSHRSSQDYFLEFTQQINAPIAMYMAENGDFIDGNATNPSWLTELAPHVMMINPSVEVYMLDSTGAVIGSSFDSEELLVKQVDLQPIQAFLQPDRVLPIKGDDPRNSADQRIFSVFPLYADSQVSEEKSIAGYVYAVIAGNKYQSEFGLIRSSYSSRMLLATLSGALLLALLSGVMVFLMLTRRLKTLTAGVADKVTALAEKTSNDIPVQFSDAQLDEIDKLEKSYQTMEHMLINQYKELEENDSNRREFIANVSHDLRTPLTTLQSYLETLLMKDDVLDEDEKQKYLRIAYRQSKHLRKLVSQLFMLTKLESGEVSPSLEEFSLLELAHDTVQEFQIKARSRAIQLSIQPKSNQGSEFDVIADIGMIHRVFVNLLSNAMRHTPANGKVSIVLGRSDDQRVNIAVIDTGIGMSQQQCQHIMRRYYTSAGSIDGISGSSGLGLAIVKNILTVHGEAITIDSEPGKGTTIRFRLALSMQNVTSPARHVLRTSQAI